MRPPEPMQPLQPPPDFLEADSFPPTAPQLYCGWIFSATSSHGSYPGAGCSDGAGLLPPSLEPGGHPQYSRLSPNLNILRPLLGPDGVARPSHPVTSLLSGKRWGHQAGVVPPATALTAPQHFALPFQGPGDAPEGIWAWMSSGQGKAQGSFASSITFCAQLRVIVTTRTGTQLLRHQVV